jgi:hypothetical protein
VLDGDLVAEEGRRLGAGVRDQRLVLVEFQLEVIMQERCQALLDLLGFGSGSGEPEEVIVGVPDISQPPVAGITRVPARGAAPLCAQLPHRSAVAPPPGVADRSGQPGVFGICGPGNSPGVFRDQDCLGEFVQPVQVDIGEDWADYAALRNTGKRRVPFPVFQVPGFQHMPDQPQEPVVVDFLRQDRDHYLVVQGPEAIGDVSLDEPGCPGPDVFHFA